MPSLSRTWVYIFIKFHFTKSWMCPPQLLKQEYVQGDLRCRVGQLSTGKAEARLGAGVQTLSSCLQQGSRNSSTRHRAVLTLTGYCSVFFKLQTKLQNTAFPFLSLGPFPFLLIQMDWRNHSLTALRWSRYYDHRELARNDFLVETTGQFVWYEKHPVCWDSDRLQITDRLYMTA